MGRRRVPPDWAPEIASTIKAATVHHTADSNDYSAADVPAIMRSIYRYHAITRGWGDIGYNVLVDKFGRIWEGRAGGLSKPVIGAHAGGFNTYTFGVSMMGNYDTAPTTPPMIDSVAAIIAWKLSLFSVDPHGHGDPDLRRDGQVPGRDKVVTCRRSSPTGTPGHDLPGPVRIRQDG